MVKNSEDNGLTDFRRALVNLLIKMEEFKKECGNKVRELNG